MDLKIYVGFNEYKLNLCYRVTEKFHSLPKQLLNFELNLG